MRTIGRDTKFVTRERIHGLLELANGAETRGAVEPAVVKSGRHVGIATLLLLSVALRGAWAVRQSDDPASLSDLPDQQEYFQTGENLLAGRGLQFTDPRFGQTVWAYRTPGYPIFIAACGANLRIVRLAQAVIDTLTVLAVYLLAMRWLPAGRCLFAAAWVALNPLLVCFSGLILSETLFIAMLAWGAWFLIGNSSGRFFIGAVILAAAVLVRPSALFLPALLALAVRPRPVASALACLGITVLVLFPWALRNELRLHAWIWTSTNSGITKYDGFNPQADGSSNQSFVKEMPQLSQMDEIQRSQYLGGLANQFIADHPWDCVKLTIAKIGRLWSPIPLSQQFGSQPRYVAVEFIYSAPFFVLCLIGAVNSMISGRGRVFLLLPALYFTVVHGFSVSSLRYRLPAEPLMAVVAGAAFGGKDEQIRSA
jgi:4-amino-4-deoxy-L-arabinose transferase-like glycosyltransferase